ncbi:MAG: zinc-ribbon domain-containing protein [Acidimicrobiia bacterium]
MAGLDPRLAAEWHPERNGELEPGVVTAKSNRRVWWRCAEGHEWQAVVSDRTSGTRCPYCAGTRPTPDRTLAARYPSLAAQWHPDRNGALTPQTVSGKSNRRVWWHCPSGHEWEAKICNRTRGDGCPYCSGKRPTPERNLAVVHPDLAAQWHPTRNGDVRPNDVNPASATRVWWRCPRGHEWTAKPETRVRGVGCPFCAGKRPSPEYNLAVLHPELAAQWHPTRNGHVRPAMVTPHSGRAVWWQCSQGHEWEAVIDRRVRQQGCPYCSGKRPTAERNLAAVHPELAEQWHPTLNGELTPNQLLPQSNRRVWWRCPQGHAWRAMVSSRATGRGCPSCADRRPKGIPLIDRAPELLDEWDVALNGGAGDQVMAGSELRAWWRCRINPTHLWTTQVRHRVRGNGCPYCAGKRPTPERNLAAVYPDVAAEWHPEENGDQSPTDVLPHSSLRLWWRCPLGHAWQARVADRTQGDGCPYCAGKRPTPQRNLAVLHPHLAAEWHPHRNQGRSPDEVTPGSRLRVYWRCPDGHEWAAKVISRVRGDGCPQCFAQRTKARSRGMPPGEPTN